MSDTTSSATGGYLLPAPPLPADGASFDALMQAMVVGITGLPGNRVIPRWQPEPPEQVSQNVDWCGIGEVSSDQQGNTFGSFNTAGQGSLTQVEWDQVEVLASFYGPNCFANAKLLRAGLFVSQNREALTAAGVAFVSMDKISRVPDLVNQIWMDRSDITLVFNRVVTRTYNILAVLSSMVTITNSVGIVDSVTAE